MQVEIALAYRRITIYDADQLVLLAQDVAILDTVGKLGRLAIDPIGDPRLQACHVASLEHPGAIETFEECPNIIIRRLADQLLWRTDLHDPTALHDRDTMTDANSFFDIVGDEDDRAFLLGLQTNQLTLHLAANQWIERRERFIHEKDRRVIGQCPGQADTLLHAARELMGKLFS